MNQSRMALAAVAKRQKPFSRSSPVKSRSGIFPRHSSSSKSRARTNEVPLFVPDEEEDDIPQIAGGSEGDEWEDIDGELEEDVQMSIAIAESLESQRRPRRTSDARPPAQTPMLETPIKPPTQVSAVNGDKAVVDDEDVFTSPSRLATQLSIAGARKPLSTRIPSGSARGTAVFGSGASSTPPSTLTQSMTAKQILGRPPDGLSEGDTSDKDESDDDMEEVQISHTTETRPPTESRINPDSPPPANPVEVPLAIGVEDVVAKRFAEFQKIFAEKRKAFRAENLGVQEEALQTRETSRAHSPGLEYADEEVEVARIQEKEEEAIEVRSSPPSHSDEDEDMEEVEIAVPPPSIAPGVSQPTGDPGPGLRSPEPFASTVAEIPPPKPVEGGEDEEGIPISDWSRSPSPQPRPPDGEEGLSASFLTLDRSRGLLDPDDSLDQGPPVEQNQEHEDFDAAHEMDPDAEAGEFARWMSQVKGRNLDDVRKEIEQEISSLRKEQKAAMRDSEDVTGQMITQIMVSLRHP